MTQISRRGFLAASAAMATTLSMPGFARGQTAALALRATRRTLDIEGRAASVMGVLDRSSVRRSVNAQMNAGGKRPRAFRALESTGGRFVISRILSSFFVWREGWGRGRVGSRFIVAGLGLGLRNSQRGANDLELRLRLRLRVDS